MIAAAEKQPAWCRTGSSNPFAKYFPLDPQPNSNIGGKQTGFYDPKTKEWTLIDVCWWFDHSDFVTDADAVAIGVARPGAQRHREPGADHHVVGAPLEGVLGHVVDVARLDAQADRVGQPQPDAGGGLDRSLVEGGAAGRGQARGAAAHGEERSAGPPRERREQDVPREVREVDVDAAAAALVMGEASAGWPVVHVRGLRFDDTQVAGAALIRPRERDLFR